MSNPISQVYEENFCNTMRIKVRRLWVKESRYSGENVSRKALPLSLRASHPPHHLADILTACDKECTFEVLLQLIQTCRQIGAYANDLPHPPALRLAAHHNICQQNSKPAFCVSSARRFASPHYPSYVKSHRSARLSNKQIRTAPHRTLGLCQQLHIPRFGSKPLKVWKFISTWHPLQNSRSHETRSARARRIIHRLQISVSIKFSVSHS